VGRAQTEERLTEHAAEMPDQPTQVGPSASSAADSEAISTRAPAQGVGVSTRAPQPRDATRAGTGVPSTSTRGQRHSHLTQAGREQERADEEGAPASAAAGQQRLELPERPALAEEVALRGPMTESAFKNPPWLIERGDRYMQVSKLLYDVAEQIDGRRTYDEIAAAVSEQIKRQVKPDDVRLIVGNLILAGVVRKADGSVVKVTEGPGGPSPLTLNMKMAMVHPRFIEPVTGILKVLYWPPVVLLVLAVAAVAEFWLYAIHGVGQGLHQAIYQPSLMVNILAAIVLAAAFHELGHAAALHYGGGRIKGMGAGLYLVYPAFYTDVTENYRLPRWSRVRTDLGGFYFNVIFALAVMALYLVVPWEFLLLVVVLINIEVIHQLLPFIRLDGYWVLADLTGIPDFFSQIKPFLRSILPSWVPFPETRKLPELKTWAKVFFLGYIIVTIPLLVLILFLMVRAVPRVLATLFDSLGKQATAFQQALGAGDMTTAFVSGLQALILLLPTLGLLFTLYSVGKRVAIAIWNWSKKATWRRAVAALGGVAVVGLLLLLWVPSVLFPGTPSPIAPGQPLAPLVQPLAGVIQFTPIQPGEAFTIQEAAAATAPPPSPSSDAAPGTGGGGGPVASAQPSAQTTASPTANPTANPTPGASPSETPAATPITSP
jgi:putative peptide zinc metalloprotease protein